VLRVSAACELAGVPSASLVCEGFVGQAKSLTPGMGVASLPLASIRGHIDALSDAELRDEVMTSTLPQVIAALTGIAVDGAVVQPEPQPDDTVFDGSFDAVNEYFYEQRWSDGLPIVPPTRERVAAFLAFTDREAHEVLGKAPPDNRAATVWNVAVNGVMAGCRPEYMPVLVALAEAMTDPRYGVEHSGNTPGSETLIVVNGPIIKELGFNYEQGVLRDGFRANTSIGRFWRLYLRNIAGFLPHLNDKGTFGGTWRVVLAENEEALASIGWPTLAVELGQAPGDSAVTVARYTGGNVVSTVVGNSAEECLPYIADALTKHTGWELIFTLGLAPGTYRPMLVLTPILARTIASSGWSKADLREYLYKHARIPARLFEKYISGWTNLVPGHRSLFDMAALGKAPKVYGESRDPNRLVPIVLRPEHFLITVAGDPLRTNCFVLPSNGMLGFPTSKRVVVPTDWTAKLASAKGRTLA
jgi:hypothetical protein